MSWRTRTVEDERARFAVGRTLLRESRFFQSSRAPGSRTSRARSEPATGSYATRSMLRTVIPASSSRAGACPASIFRPPCIASGVSTRPSAFPVGTVARTDTPSVLSRSPASPSSPSGGTRRGSSPTASSPVSLTKTNLINACTGPGRSAPPFLPFEPPGDSQAPQHAFDQLRRVNNFEPPRSPRHSAPVGALRRFGAVPPQQPGALRIPRPLRHSRRLRRQHHAME